MRSRRVGFVIAAVPRVFQGELGGRLHVTGGSGVRASAPFH
jgi:hypothetical protein